jgi:P4 family phage/plasmid primase-like protien
VQIPVTYDPSAECPAWDKFVSEVFPEDAQELAYELAADLITPSRSSQKALLLLGEGSNGKSTYLRALTAFVGSTNAAGVSLHKLESDRFATARLMGKLANICPDLPSTHLTETSVFKAIVGGDDLHAEYKYGESFEFQPYCRLVFSANHVPRSGDASHAFFRRWLVVPFDRTFEGTEQIPRETLDAKLSDARELSGVLNRALEVMERVRSKGFTESQSMRKAWEEFKLMTDPVSVWLDRNTVTAAAAWCVKADLIAAYNKSADGDGRAGMTAQAFGRALKRARPGVEETQKTIDDRRVWCYTGIGLSSPDGDDTEPDGARAARDARDSTNCFVPDGDNAKVTSKEKRVQRVQGVQDDRQTSFSGERNAEQKSLSEGEGNVVELRPDNPSSSLDEPPSGGPPGGTLHHEQNDVVDGGQRLTGEEVTLFKQLRVTMRPEEARAEIMRRRERDGSTA